MSALAALLLLASAAPPECSDGSDAAMVDCWGAAFHRADAQLNAVWPNLVAAAKEKDKSFLPLHSRQPSAEADLIVAERVWLKLRDTECALESDYAEGGTLQPIIAVQCQTRMTRERVKQLQDILSGFREG